MLEMDRDKVCFIVTRMHEYEQEDLIVAGTDEQEFNDEDVEEFWENTVQEGEYESLGTSTPKGSSPTQAFKEELETFIKNLDEEEQIELVALAWVGRGDFEVSEWQDAIQTATERHNERTSNYLMGMPLLADYLEEGLAAFELSCTDFDESRM